ncbi:MAG: tyrosine-type recombinase/integrase [Planctomycetota bacterium]
MSQSTRKSPRRKPSKPYPDFPLTANGNGQWSKRIRGKTYYFGLWEDPDGALAQYLEVRDDRYAGRAPKAKGLTVKDLANHYLAEQEHKWKVGEIRERTFRDSQAYCTVIVESIGTLEVDNIRAQDFTTMVHRFPDSWGPTMRGKIVKQTKAIFRFGVENEFCERLPAFGSRFKLPTRKDKQKSLAGRQRGEDVFTPQQIRKILDHCRETGQPQLRTMVLLAINCGFGNADCGRLRDSDIQDGWIRIYRHKTGEERDCPLWPETLEAINQWLEVRTKQCGDLVFVTKYGGSWHKENGEKSPISQAFKRVTGKLDIKPSFYKLRHTFQTVCDRSQIPRYVTRQIMGHAGQSISDDYSHGVTDEQLRNAASAVHDWLFGEGGVA